ncbi:hypothetical protein [Massilia sp. NP310]|uniref:hypothetical protein n=1 Tax=Massilia sp. NP310 TaxID=2861282 RepID=UPI001C630A4A|nr:hypothetical protein [Massilia sp. NP310]QYG04039.1 hypothetical protein KY496_11975 [Massilia sp. NP310]
MLAIILAGLLAMAISLGIILAIIFPVWLLWCWVVPQVFIGWPEHIASPGFLLFAACWILAGFVGRLIFGSRSKQAK